MSESVAARVVTALITDGALDVSAHRVGVASPQAGAEVVFTGVVRDHDHGRAVRSLEYVAHPDAHDVIGDIATEIAGRGHVVAVAVSHRVGALEIGDVALVAAVSTAHRGDAFGLCRDLVEQVKHRLPVWKHQIFLDGTDEWVNCP